MNTNLQLGLRPLEQPSHWDKWQKSLWPNRCFDNLDYRNSLPEKLSPSDIQERLFKIAQLWDCPPENHEVRKFCIRRVIDIYKQNEKGPEIRQNMKKMLKILLDPDSIWLLKSVKVEWVALWALLNDGDFRQDVPIAEINKIKILKDLFRRGLLDQIARNFFDEGFYYVALQFYLLVAVKEEAPFIYSQIGRCLHFLGEPGKALEYFEKADEMMGQNLAIFSSDIKKSDLVSGQRINLSEGIFLHLINKGDTYFMLHDYNSALEEYKKALEGLEQYKEALRELDRQSSRSKRQEQVPQESRIDPKQKALANKRISVLLVFNALLIIRTLSKISDRRNERQDYFNDYLDGQWDSEDEEEFNKWVFEHFPNTEICYRFFTTFKECTPFFDEMKMIVRLKDSPYPFMTYESRRQKKMFPFTEAHPAVMRPFSKFYPEGKSRQLLTLTQAFFANHPSIAKIHKTLGHQEEDPITKRECYQQALLHAKTWNKKMHSPENASDQTTIIDQRIALYKVGRMYEFLGKTYQSLGKIVRAWDCYAKALEPINGWNGHPFWQHIQMKQEELDIYIKKLKKKPSVDFFYQLASKHIKMQRYPEAVLYFAHTLTDLSKASSERETPLDYRDVKRWLTASLKRIPSSENIEISKMLDQAGHHLMKAGKYELARECFSKIDLGYKGKIGFMMSYFAEKMYFHALRECNEVLDELSESNADEEVITTFRKHIKKILVELKDKNQSTLMNLAVEEFEEIEQRSLASYHREHLYVDHAAETGGYPSDPDSSDFDASEEVQKTWKGIMEDALTHLSQFDEESDLIDFWREKLQSFSS